MSETLKNLQISMMTKCGPVLIGIIKNWEKHIPKATMADVKIVEFFGDVKSWHTNTYWHRNIQTLAMRAEGAIFR